ncbi:hypothetical protein MKQ68_07790 [Chitinophaga horti]|uniref:DUF4369 domain-containing protein n=1 Tax=Chitinophaga horti TaxID=2920382 RepID=A0ABY6J9L1_9BACT|nr:hypothetical protein [Chitinophaga horti]UYQ94994.1 hypothetical protein MKQ68_07790 [Chitinophaga horti]
MKHFLFLPILLINIVTVQAQKLAYERADYYSKALSGYQLAGSNGSYTIQGVKYSFAFPEASFRITFYNQMAALATYYSTGNKEMLVLVDSIDMAKVKGITYHKVGDEVVDVRLHLKGSAPAFFREILDGKEISRTKVDVVHSYVKKGPALSEFVTTLYKLCFEMQVAQGLITQAEADAQNRDRNITPETFITRYPNSIFNMEAKQLIEARARAAGNNRNN